jgi:hypothetical protein
MPTSIEREVARFNKRRCHRENYMHNGTILQWKAPVILGFLKTLSDFGGEEVKEKCS